MYGAGAASDTVRKGDKYATEVKPSLEPVFEVLSYITLEHGVQQSRPWR